MQELEQKIHWSSDSRLTGSILSGQYEVKELIARGGMGSVYRAFDLRLQREVAIKTLHFEGVLEPVVQERFLREARALSSLNHPNIVRLFSSGLTENGYPYYVMEFLEGKTLEKKLEEGGALNPTDFIEIILQTLSGLAEAHDKNIAHRDLNPKNVMICKGLDDATVVKVIDFGIARVADAEAGGKTLTRTNAILGTPSYMSPEQCRGEKGDKLSDIYSLGCLMYACLSGCPPFSGDSGLQLMYKHLNEEAPPLRFKSKSKEAQILRNLIASCMEKESGRRPQSVDEISALIRKDLQRKRSDLFFELSKSRSRLSLVVLFAAVLLSVILGCYLVVGKKIENKEALKQVKEHKDRFKARRLSLKMAEERAQNARGARKAEALEDLAGKLHRLGREELNSNDARYLEDVILICRKELKTCMAAGSGLLLARKAGCYDLLADASARLGNFEEAEQALNECEKVVVQLWGDGSRQWQELTMDRARINVMRHSYAAAADNVEALFSLLSSRQENPKTVINESMLLDKDGFDLITLLLDTHKEVEKGFEQELLLKSPVEALRMHVAMGEMLARTCESRECRSETRMAALLHRKTVLSPALEARYRKLASRIPGL